MTGTEIPTLERPQTAPAAEAVTSPSEATVATPDQKETTVPSRLETDIAEAVRAGHIRYELSQSGGDVPPTPPVEHSDHSGDDSDRPERMNNKQQLEAAKHGDGTFFQRMGLRTVGFFERFVSEQTREEWDRATQEDPQKTAAIGIISTAAITGVTAIAVLGWGLPAVVPIIAPVITAL